VKKDANVTNYMPSPEFAPEFALDIVLLERDALAVILAANSSAE